MNKQNIKNLQKLFVVFLVLTFLVGVVDAQRKRRRGKRKTLKALVIQNDKFEKFVNNYEINPDGTKVETLEISLQINRFVYGKIPFVQELIFNSDIEELELLEAYKISSDGTKSIVPKNKIEIRRTPQAEAAPAFSSLKMLKIDFGQITRGDKFNYKIKRTEKKTHFKGKFSELLVFTAYYDFKLVEVNIKAPSDFPIKAQTEGLVGGKVSEENGKTNYSWKLENFKGKILESGQTSYFDFSPKLSISSFESYEELANFYKEETKKKTIITAELQALADKVTAGIAEPKEQASAIYLWVNKNIRYLSIILDRGGWIPHSAGEILKNGYGDCKDYSTLIQTLLKAKGIESSQVLVRSDESYWFPKITMPETFDHVILYIPSLNLYADATAANTRLGLISKHLRGKTTVRVSEEPKVIKIADSKPEDNQFISDVAVKYNGLGDIQAIATNTYIGESEMEFRPVFADSDFYLANSDYLVAGYLEYYGIEGTGKILNVSNSHKVGKPFNVEIEVNLANQTTFGRRGTLELPPMLNLHNLWYLETAILPAKSARPVNIGASRVKETFNLEVPDQVKIVKIPKDVSLESPFGMLTVNYKLVENNITIEREFVLNKGLISAEEYLAFKKFVRKALDSFNGSFQYRTSARYSRQKYREKKRKLRSKKIDYDAIEKLTKRQAMLLERNLEKKPNDSKTRKRLIKYLIYEAETTPLRKKKLLNHQIWFIRNKPNTEHFEFIGYYKMIEDEEKSTYETLKTEWLKAIEKHKTDFIVRYNTILFLLKFDYELSTKLAVEGEELFPNRFEFPAVLFSLKQHESTTTTGEAEKLALLEEAFTKGELSLNLLKKERSERRDAERAILLPELGQVAFELEKYDKVKNFAKELILEFGDDETDFSFAAATHKGNILLGKVAIINDEKEKAKKYLLTAIKAPLRVNANYLSFPDLALAESLLLLGEKETVLEYLKLCEKLDSANKLTLKKLQAKIKQGQIPKFSWF